MTHAKFYLLKGISEAWRKLREWRIREAANHQLAAIRISSENVKKSSMPALNSAQSLLSILGCAALAAPAPAALFDAAALLRAGNLVSLGRALKLSGRHRLEASRGRPPADSRLIGNHPHTYQSNLEPVAIDMTRP